jgi:hypothetical protein
MSVTASPIRRRKWLLWGALVVIALGGFVLWFFEPQALFLNDKVSEAAPDVAGDVDAEEDGAGGGNGPAPERGVLSKSDFTPLGHDARGTALVIDAADGNTYIRFENFEVENGPDLKVYLSKAPADAPEGELAANFIDLGELKGNIGDQNYLVPASADISEYQSVVVWCKRFSVGFAVAPVDVMSS